MRRRWFALPQLVAALACMVVASKKLSAECPLDCHRGFDKEVDCPGGSRLLRYLPRFVPDPCDCNCYYVCRSSEGAHGKDDDAWLSTHQCCARCSKWDDSLLSCVPTKKCTDHLPIQETGICILYPVEGKIDAFVNDRVIMTCAVGTVFDPLQCTCVHATVEVHRKEVACFDFDHGTAGTQGEWAAFHEVRTETEGCVHGNCVRFENDTSQIVIPRFANAFDPWGEFSMSFWYKTNIGGGVAGMISNADCDDEYPFLYVLTAGEGLVQVTLFNDNLHGAHASSSAKLNEWHHLVMTWNSVDALKMYLDRKLVSTKQLTGPIHRNDYPLVLGTQQCAHKYGLNNFIGYMDQICTYNVVLDEKDIKKLYKEPWITVLP